MKRFSDVYLRVMWPRSHRDRQPIDFSLAILTYRLAVLVERAVDGAALALAAWRKRRRRRMAVWDLLRYNDRLLSDMGLDRGRIQAYIDGLEDDPTLKSRLPTAAWVRDMRPDTRRTVASLSCNDDAASGTA